MFRFLFFPFQRVFLSLSLSLSLSFSSASAAASSVIDQCIHTLSRSLSRLSVKYFSLRLSLSVALTRDSEAWSSSNKMGFNFGFGGRKTSSRAIANQL